MLITVHIGKAPEHTIKGVIDKMEEKGHILADEKNIDSAEVEIIEEGESSETIIGWMLTRI